MPHLRGTQNLLSNEQTVAKSSERRDVVKANLTLLGEEKYERKAKPVSLRRFSRLEFVGRNKACWHFVQVFHDISFTQFDSKKRFCSDSS